MSATVVFTEVTKAKRCCARCGLTPKDAREDKRHGLGVICNSWGVSYDKHYWINWEPAKEKSK